MSESDRSSDDSQLHMDDGIDVGEVHLHCQACDRPMDKPPSAMLSGDRFIAYTYSCLNCENKAMLLVPLGRKLTPKSEG